MISLNPLLNGAPTQLSRAVHAVLSARVSIPF